MKNGQRALISVSDKRGVVEFARELRTLGFEIISTGGTAKALSEAGLEVLNASDITGFPECLDGRVKTLHPAIHAGILAMRSNPEHMNKIEDLGINTIDVVAINLYPFKKTVQRPDVTLEEAIENIDIGGPAMLRSAAKNYRDVAVVCNPDDYASVICDIKNLGAVSVETKMNLAYKAFEHTSHYDTLIAEFLRKRLNQQQFPETMSLTFEKAQDMRYGENPHQKAAFYRSAPHGGNSSAISAARQLHGKELSYNNINDTNGALELIKELTEPCVVAVKHANPCGVGIGNNIFEAWSKAYEADSVSIFGGIVALNRQVDAETAQKMSEIFLEIVIAPSFSRDALDILTQKKNIRLLELRDIAVPFAKDMFDMKRVAGGLLIQERDVEIFDEGAITCVTERRPTEAEMTALRFNWRVVKHTKSNAIVLGLCDRTVGIGPGQTNRITAAELAIKYAGDKAKGTVMASDAYFPFPDCVEAAAKAGITAIIQPGGSKNDQASIDACNKHAIAMLMTGMRHFKH